MTQKQVEKFLEVNGPSLSSEVANYLTNLNKISNEAARKVISRLAPPIVKMRGVNFKNRKKLLYLEEQFNSSSFTKSLIKILMQEMDSFGIALCAIYHKGGAIPYNFFHIYSGGSFQRRKKNLLSTTILQNLKNLKVLESSYGPSNLEIISIRDSLWTERNSQLLEVEQLAVEMAKDWLRKTNFCSWDSVRIRNYNTEMQPHFGGYCWDLVGPSYLYTLKKGKDPGFIVMDIYLKYIKSIDQISYFIKKVNSIRLTRGLPNCIPMLIHKGMDKEVLDTLKKTNIMIADRSIFLGDDRANILDLLENILANAAAVIKNDPEKVFDLLTKIKKIEGATFNVNGALFEMISAHILYGEGYFIEMRKVVIDDNNNRAEIDIQAMRQDEIICIECKGYQKGNTIKLNEIQNWVDKKLPVIQSWIKKNKKSNKGSLPNNARIEFNISSKFTPDVLEYIKHISSLHKRIPISFNEIDHQLSRTKNSKAIKDMLNEHFG